ncbi:MAG: mannitol-1-phosphate 5-dehydrogenase [Armatimonadetes bacterium]|nr:mannitol-1-phosphate 5-dehydrogenase [Armatimonadota bacterium]
MDKLVQIGAGNIGRSFVGQIFSRAGFEVVFVDVDQEIIDALNEQGHYIVEIKDKQPRSILVENVMGINGRETALVAEELATCRVAATAVGPAALPYIYPNLAAGLMRRRELGNGPLDVIICENMRDAAEAMYEGVAQHLPSDFPLREMLGAVETSIGKMVPIMSEEDRARDPLLVFAEEYNTLICDARGFLNPVPDVPELEPKQNMKAYVDRKLFLHNLGHALCAYFSHLEDPSLEYTWQAVEHPRIGPAVRAGMMESAAALIAAYPEEFNEDNLREHVDDLIERFANRALGDTIYRVGRDIRRKLGGEDRVIGALRLDVTHHINAPYTCLCAAAGMRFRATDENGEMYEQDLDFARHIYPEGAEQVLREVSGLKPGDPVDEAIMQAVLSADRFVAARLNEGRSILDLEGTDFGRFGS